MDVTIHSKRSDFHSGKLGDKVVNIQLTRRDFHVREPDPVNFIGAIEISTRSVELSKVPKPVKLVAATISLPVSKPQVIIMIASINLVKSVTNNIDNT